MSRRGTNHASRLVVLKNFVRTARNFIIQTLFIKILLVLSYQGNFDTLNLIVFFFLPGGRSSMAIDASGVWPAPSCRRGAVAAYKFRVREERKRVIRLSNEKYRTIDDHESGLRRFVLIK